MHFSRLAFWLTGVVLFSTGHLQAADYYWIGGSGNWSDLSHWATTSGGGLTHAQAPTADDDVYFDANSFTGAGQVVTINTGIAFCRTMDWTGAVGTPRLVAAQGVRLSIFGGIQLIPDMDFAFTGDVIFSGNDAGNTIDFSTHDAGRNVTFSGNGDWRLTAPLRVDSTIYFQEGRLNTNDQSVNCQYFSSRETGNRTLELANSTLTIGGSNLEIWFNSPTEFNTQALRLHAQNLSIDPGGSTIVFTNPNAQFAVQGPGQVNLNRVEFSNPNGLSFILPFDRFNDLSNYPDLSIAELDLRHNTQLLGGADIGIMTLYPDKRYGFESGFTYEVDDIQATGDCQMGISLSATDAVNPAEFSTTAAVSVDFVNLLGIRATGSGSFTANNAINLGNSPGWTINERASQDLYWIGGFGDWGDPAHWSFTSGGPGSGCLPSAVDDVFFDENSFGGMGQVVDLDVEDAYCRSMDWTGASGNPTLRGVSSNNLRINGSLTFIADMNHTFEGNYFFVSDQPGNTITTAGQPFNQDLHFSGNGGEWTLQDSVYVEWGLYFNSGILRTNDQFVETNWFYSLDPVDRELYLGKSRILTTWRENRSGIWDVFSTNLTIDASESTIESGGGFGNLFATNGATTVAYNNLIFSAPEVRMFAFTDDPVTVDSLFWLRDGFTAAFEQQINYLQLNAGHSYSFRADDTHFINTLDANGDCEDGLVYIRGANAGFQANFNIANDQDVSRVFVQDIHQVGAGTLTATESLDGGNTPGWMITGGGGRDLYWVGNAGDWHDTANWSLTSGGPGGECVPTPEDNVFFDENSFSGPNQNVYNVYGQEAVCRDYTFTEGVTENPFVEGLFLNVFGSLSLRAPLTWYLQVIRFKGREDHTIETSGNVVNGVVIEDDGNYELLDPLTANYTVDMFRGRLASNDHLITADGFFGVGDLPAELDLGNGRFRAIRDDVGPFNSGFAVFNCNFRMAAGNHTVEMTGNRSRLRTNCNLEINNVEFSDPQGWGEIWVEENVSVFTANKISFSGDGNVVGRMETDSLFCAPGKSYVLESGRTQTINDYWEIIGNNCTSIELSSSEIGSPAMVSMPASGEILANFIQMRDIAASGGADFLAGAFSTNIANSNTGWIFESRPDLVEVGFLGPDRALCSGEPVVLDAYNFSVGEAYRWSDNSTDATLTVASPGTYFARVTFLDNCTLIDTVEVIAGQDFAVNLPENPEICEGDQLELNPGLDLVGASFEWQDGSNAPTLFVSDPGEYYVTVNLGGCVETDTTVVQQNTYPAIELGEDLTRCPEQDFTLEAGSAAETYLWQDGSTGSSFMGDAPGTYFLEAANGSCVAFDTVRVMYVDPGSFSLGNDTTLCDQSGFTLTAELPGASFAWQDGSTNADFTATADGEYFVEATVSGCSVSDTIVLDFFTTPDLEVDSQYAGCTGDPITITALAGADAYAWSDGDTDGEFSTLMGGDYALEATFGPCSATTDFTVVFNDYPTVAALGMDSTLCEGDNWTLTATTDLGVVTWQDGSTDNSFTVNAAGDYFFTADNAGCVTNSESVNVEVLDLPDLDVAGEYTACAGTTFSLSTDVTADSYAWSNGDSGPTFSSTTPGSYTLTVRLDHCSVTDDFAWTVVNPPAVELGEDRRLCAGTPLLLQAGQPGTWQDGTVSATYAVENTGLYVVTVGDEGCSTTDSVSVEVLALPSFTLGEDLRACEGENVQLMGPANLGTLAWDDGTGDPVRNVTVSGQYVLRIEDADGCVGRDSVRVDFAPLPLLELGPDTIACDNSPYVIQPELGPGVLTWFDGSGEELLSVASPSVITAELNNDGCISRDTVSVRFRECVFFQAFLPNAFTPDQDGNNDEFRPFFDDRLEIIAYEMRVYARWGDLMFVTQDPEEGWRGESRGQILKSGVYLYTINLTYRDDTGVSTETMGGDVLLLR